MTNEMIVGRYRDGEPGALEELYHSTRRLVSKICSQYAGAGRDDSEDLEQESFFILKEAADHYDPGAGTKFSTYLAQRLKWKLPRVINGMRGLHLPEYRMLRVSGLDKAEIRGMDRQQVMERYGWSASVYEQARSDRELLHGTSLDRIVQEDGRMSLFDLTGSGDTAFDALEDWIDNSMIWAEVSKLPEQEREIIQKKYKAGQDLREISRQTGLSYAAVTFCHQKALRALEHNARIRGIAEARAYQMTGLAAFRRTGSSVTERVALWELEHSAGTL